MDLPPLDPKAPDYKKQFKRRLSVEAINIETQEAHELADRVLKRGFFDKKGKFKPVRFVDHVLKCFLGGTFVTPMSDQGGDVVWRYDEARGIFVSDGVPFIEQALKNILGEETTTAQYNHVVKHLQVSTYTDPRDFKEMPEIMVLQNGAFNLYTGDLLPHSPEYKARNALPITYDPGAECPIFLKFLERVIPNPEDREFFREWLGFHLLKDYRYQRVVVLQGDGDNGKSTLLAAMVAILGPENVASENLYRLSSNRFSAAELYGKLANIAADIGPDELRYTGILKMLSGNDRLTAERKNRDPFQFVNYAKMSFSCNLLPRTPDETLAFYKRFIVIVTGDPIPKDEQNDHMLEEITTPEELSGVFNWAYEGLQHALERGRLEEPSEIQERRELYQNMSDPVNGFYNDFIEEERESFEIKQDVLNAFYDYCKNKGFVPLSERKFVERFKKIAYVRNYKPKLWTTENPKGSQVNCWRGIKLSDACKKTPYWSTKAEYDAVNHTQKRLEPGENIQHIKNIKGSQTRSEMKISEKKLVNPGYAGYPGYDGPNSADLVSKAESVLKLNKGMMLQTAFWDHLEKVGHKRMEAEYVLREDPWFAFMGLYVKLVGCSCPNESA